MKILVSVLLCVLVTKNIAHASTGDTNTQASADAAKAIKQISAYQDEASKLSAAAVFSQLEILISLRRSKQQSGSSPFALDDDLIKSVGYASDLEARRKDGNPEGAYYHGVYNLRICGGLELGDTEGNFTHTVRECFIESLDSFKIASAARMGSASFSIGRMYEKGWGVLPSKLAAADWFTKAAQQFSESSSREQALTSIEAALTVAPDHPEALRLKNRLVK